LRDGRPALVVSGIDYPGLTDAMFHMISQNGNSQPAVLIRLLEVLTAVAECEPDGARRKALARHADLALREAERNGANALDLDDIRERHAAFVLAQQRGGGVVQEREVGVGPIPRA
jgi:uncharacterized membrane protein